MVDNQRLGIISYAVHKGAFALPHCLMLLMQGERVVALEELSGALYGRERTRWEAPTMWRRASDARAEHAEQRMPIEQQIKNAEQEWLDAYQRGPSRTRWTKLPPQVGDRAPDLELQDMTGAPVRLSELWRDRPALLLFWRHYGCSCGIERSNRLRLRHEYADFVAAGASVAIIGQGEPERAAVYAEKYSLPPCPILCDPTLRAYQAYGLPQGTPIQILYDAPEEFWRREYKAGVDLAKARREEGRPAVDDPWQLPGEFVIRPDGTIAFAYRYQYCDNIPNPLILVAAIIQANGAS
jgi:peroxiredoxin